MYRGHRHFRAIRLYIRQRYELFGEAQHIFRIRQASEINSHLDSKQKYRRRIAERKRTLHRIRADKRCHPDLPGGTLRGRAFATERTFVGRFRERPQARLSNPSGGLQFRHRLGRPRRSIPGKCIPAKDRHGVPPEQHERPQVVRPLPRR